MERALTKFLSKTCQTHNLFDSDEANIFPCMYFKNNSFLEQNLDGKLFISVIACKPQFPPYINALLPKDQIFDPEDLEQDTKQHEEQPVPPKKRIKIEHKTSENKLPFEINLENTDHILKVEDVLPQNWDIDNPYLAATKLPTRSVEC